MPMLCVAIPQDLTPVHAKLDFQEMGKYVLVSRNIIAVAKFSACVFVSVCVGGRGFACTLLV